MGATNGSPRGVVTAAAAVGLASWFWATVAAAHPAENFARVRRLDPTGIGLPNWRFFAPNPASFDYGLLYRLERADGTTTPWAFVMEPIHRTWLHTVWFPENRRVKALTDMMTEVRTVVGELSVRGRLEGGLLEQYPVVTALRDFTTSVVRERHHGEEPAGFQYSVIEHAGYDERAMEEPHFLFLSSFVALDAVPVRGVVA